MPRKKEWTREQIVDIVYPKVQEGWSMVQIARSLGISRQRLYKILADGGLSLEDLKKGNI